MELMGKVDDRGRWMCSAVRFQAVEEISEFGICLRLYV